MLIALKILNLVAFSWAAMRSMSGSVGIENKPGMAV